MKPSALALLFAFGLMSFAHSAALADSIVVTSLADDGGAGELRAAMNAANNAPGSTITFASALTGTITLTSSLPEIYTTTTIAGPGASIIAINAAGHNLPFFINAPNCSVKISGLTIEHGSGSLTVTSGGAILVGYGSLWLDSCVVANNTIVGIWNYSLLTMTNCTVSGNGGATGYGGGLYNYGVATVTDSTFVGNMANGYDGGAIYDPGYDLTVSNCTFTGNSASRGGAIDNANQNNQKLGASITNCTIAGNVAESNGAGIEDFNGANTVITNCIVYDNKGGGEINTDPSSDPGAFGTLGAVATYCDVQGGFPGAGNIDADPLLAALADNGGLTETTAPSGASPVYGTGTAVGAPDIDQRGLLRPPTPSMGAYDDGRTPPPLFSLTSGPEPSGQTVNLTDSYTGASIYYTTDGSTPTTESPRYEAPITIQANEAISAIAVASFFGTSTVATQAYTIGPTHVFAAGLAMISVPEDFGGHTAGEILGYTNPVLALWDPSSNTYDVTPSASVATLTPGVGYWIRVPQVAKVAVPGTPAPTAAPFLIPLHSGWNMVGDPFLQSVPLDEVMISLYVNGPTTWLYSAFAAQNWVGSTVWGFDGTNYVAASSLDPYQGYWVYAQWDCTLVVPPPA